MSSQQDLLRVINDLQRRIGELERREDTGATATVIGGVLHGATAKTTPGDADTIPLIDSADSNALKKITWANIKATLSTLYVGLTGDQTVAGSKTFSDVTFFASFVRWTLSGVNKALAGVATTTNNLINGTVAGDLAIRTASGQKILLSTDDGTTAAMTIAADGNISASGDLSAKSYVTSFQNINDDAVYSFTPTTPFGMVAVSSSNHVFSCGIAFFRSTSGASTAVIAGGASFAVTTGALTGTTGTDDKLNVSAHTDGKVYIENRTSAARTFAITVIG